MNIMIKNVIFTKNHKDMRPEFLKEGDTIAVIAIASAPSDAQLAMNWKEQLEKANSFLRTRLDRGII